MKSVFKAPVPAYSLEMTSALSAQTNGEMLYISYGAVWYEGLTHNLELSMNFNPLLNPLSCIMLLVLFFKMLWSKNVSSFCLVVREGK